MYLCLGEGGEKTIRDCIERLISFHSIDIYIGDISSLLEMGWIINDGTNNTDYNNKVFKMFRQGKGKRLLKISNKYMINYYKDYE